MFGTEHNIYVFHYMLIMPLSLILKKANNNLKLKRYLLTFCSLSRTVLPKVWSVDHMHHNNLGPVPNLGNQNFKVEGGG
jgi:hypothetical protein